MGVWDLGGWVGGSSWAVPSRASLVFPFPRCPLVSWIRAGCRLAGSVSWVPPASRSSRYSLGPGGFLSVFCPWLQFLVVVSLSVVDSSHLSCSWAPGFLSSLSWPSLPSLLFVSLFLLLLGFLFSVLSSSLSVSFSLSLSLSPSCYCVSPLPLLGWTGSVISSGSRLSHPVSLGLASGSWGRLVTRPLSR